MMKLPKSQFVPPESHVQKPISQIISKIRKIDETELVNLKKRLDIVSIVALCFISILAFRLWFLQIHKGSEYKKLSENNRIRVQSLAAARGNVLDRAERLIIANRPAFNVVWTREDAPDPDFVLKQLAKILNSDINLLLDRVREASDLPRYMPIRLAEDIDWKTLAQIENRHFELPGVQIESMPMRDYLFSNSASHLIGYLGEINRKELDALTDQEYVRGDQIGKMGIEKIYESTLRGAKGRRYLEVDSHGFEQRLLHVQESMPGNDIQLTLDMDLQQTAEDVMAEKSGAIVAMDVNSGRLLVLASTPEITLTDFVGGISQASWQSLLNNPLKPLINKTIQGQYPPGSTYKIITAAAALSEGVVTPETTFYCSGSLQFGNRTYGCWKRSGHGQVNLKKALSQSCDVYFYHVGQKLGVDTLAEYARSFGLGQTTYIPMEHEKAGLVPSSSWKIQKYQEKWHEGETLSVAIGQGFNLTTPLQVCQMTAATANGGTLYRPQFIERVRDSDGNVVKEFRPMIGGTVKATQRALDLINEGMTSVVNDPHGTGQKARLPDVLVAGKTGTAQVVRLKQTKSELEQEIPYHLRDHAWFTSFAPADHPEIAVTVLIEHGGGGGAAAAPIAKMILARYFELKTHQPDSQTKGRLQNLIQQLRYNDQ